MVFDEVSKDYLEVLKGVDRKVIAPIEHSVRPSRISGGRITKTRLGILEITVPVFLTRPRGQSWERVKEDLSGWLYQNEDKKLTFKSSLKMSVDRHYMARFSGMEFDEGYNYSDGIITFICQDPYRMGSGSTLTLTKNLDDYKILGQVETDWIFKVVLTKAATVLILSCGNRGVLTVTHNFISGDVIEINSKKRRVTLNGNNIAGSLAINSVWFKLMPGINSLSFNGVGRNSVTYTDRYF